MNKYNALIRYQTVMAWARSLLSKSIISKAEYTRIDTMMLKKYGISSFVFLITTLIITRQPIFQSFQS